MMVWNFEYRIHGPFFGDRLQTILFADAGKLWTRGIDVAQPFKWTPGVAFRVFSPVGPIQVNVGYNDYGTQAGPVFFDPGISGSSLPLICVVNSAPFAGPSCPASFSIPRPAKFLSRLHFSIAFPPDY